MDQARGWSACQGFYLCVTLTEMDAFFYLCFSPQHQSLFLYMSFMCSGGPLPASPWSTPRSQLSPLDFSPRKSLLMTYTILPKSAHHLQCVSSTKTTLYHPMLPGSSPQCSYVLTETEVGPVRVCTRSFAHMLWLLMFLWDTKQWNSASSWNSFPPIVLSCAALMRAFAFFFFNVESLLGGGVTE